MTENTTSKSGLPVALMKPANSAGARSKTGGAKKKASTQKIESWSSALAFRPFDFKIFEPGKTTTFSMENMMTSNKNHYDKFAAEAAHVGDAMMKCGTILTKGMEDIAKAQMSWAQELAEKNGNVFKSMMACKTINEFTEMQNRLAQESFDDFMSGATKISELSVKVATEAFEPLNDQMTKAMKKATESMAA